MMSKGTNKRRHISILGGGVGGLAAGYYAKKNGLPFTIYEASSQIGGNCITLRQGDFLYDSGAHRFHDQDANVTKEIKKLLGDEVMRIDVPSRIYHSGKMIEFPLAPLNLMKQLGPATLMKSIVEVVSSRLIPRKGNGDFQDFAERTYGPTLSKHFLINYSEKLWGARCNRLSATIAGRRLKGLGLRTLLKNTIFGNMAKAEHLDGCFYYPKMGIGSIAEKLAEFCGLQNIRINSKVTKILCNCREIEAIEINGKEKVSVDEVINTMPITHFLEVIEPKASNVILQCAKNLRYRSMILVAFFLNRRSVTEFATVYFPEFHFPFTRVYEPRNRSRHMVPQGKTSLIAETPCMQNDRIWEMEDSELVKLVRSKFVQIGWIKEEEIIDAFVNRITYAYPILEVNYEKNVQEINNFLRDFSNLEISGRNGKFTYSWIHDMMKYGKEIIDGYIHPIKVAERQGLIC